MNVIALTSNELENIKGGNEAGIVVTVLLVAATTGMGQAMAGYAYGFMKGFCEGFYNGYIA
jgi:hypothetical protein